MIYTFFTLGIFESFFLATILFFKKNKSLPDNLLALSFVIIGINILFSCLECFNKDHNFAYPFLINISSPLVMLHGPLLWYYSKSQTTPKFHFRLKNIIHFVPFIILLVYHYLAFYRHSPAEKVEMAKTESFVHTFIYQFLLVFMIIVIFSYLISCIIILNKHKKNIENYFSNKSKIDMHWLKLVIFGAMFTYIVVYTLIILNEYYHFTTFKTSEAIGYCMATILVFIWGFYGIQQTQIFSSFKIGYFEDDKVEMSDNKDEDVNKLLMVMKTSKPFLDPELTIAKLSEISVVPVTKLSIILNSKFNKTFFDFVNTYRIEEFKTQLQKPENNNLTLLGISYNCGFNSKATFNRVFKNYLHITPKAYKSSIAKK
jgi:AraC-like DNA-binding protein